MNVIPPIIYIIVSAVLVIILASYFLARLVSRHSGKITFLKAFIISLVSGLVIFSIIMLYYISSLFENG